MSNSNNPYLPYLTEEDNNKNENNGQSNNKVKNNNDILSLLEEGDSSTAAPPPAYEDVVKPQPALPGYNDHYSHPPYNQQSYPPPVSENYHQIPHTVPANSNEKSGHRLCCFGASRRNKNCGCGWIIVLMIFLILGSISLANNNACGNISLSNKGTYNFDPTNTILKIDVDYKAQTKDGEVRILQNPAADETAVKIEVNAASKGTTPKFVTSEQNGIFELSISRTDGFSLFNIPPRCMRSQINVYLPQNTNAANTIQVGDLNVNMVKNTVPYQQNISVSTNRNILLDGISSNAQSMNIETKNDDVIGSITSLPKELSITTIDGDLRRLHLGVTQNSTKITVKTNDGDIGLRFTNSSFLGNYDIQSNGRIRTINVNANSPTNIHKSGSVGSGGNATLNIMSVDGDVVVTF